MIDHTVSAGLPPYSACCARTIPVRQCVGLDVKFVSIASMATLCFSQDAGIHLFESLRPPRDFQRTKHLVRLGGLETRRGLQQHAIDRILDDKASARIPMPALPDRFGQDHLSFGREPDR